jgi:hypothetical protein
MSPVSGVTHVSGSTDINHIVTAMESVRLGLFSADFHTSGVGRSRPESDDRAGPALAAHPLRFILDSFRRSQMPSGVIVLDRETDGDAFDVNHCDICRKRIHVTARFCWLVSATEAGRCE